MAWAEEAVNEIQKIPVNADWRSQDTCAASANECAKQVAFFIKYDLGGFQRIDNKIKK